MRDYEEKSYYEIQLDNKQLILVFLAGVTVCVLVFILGVMVGKGRKEAEFASIGKTEQKVVRPEPDLTPPQEIQEMKPEAKKREKQKENSKETTTSTQEDPAYYELDTDKEKPLEKEPTKNQKEEKAVASKETEKKTTDTKKSETAKAETPKAEAPKTEAPKTEVAKAETETYAEPVEEKTVPEPTLKDGGKYTVQIMATSSKAKAEQQLSTLQANGYTAFMKEEKAGATSVFKVRVGRFNEKDAAKKLATKLKQELQLESWVANLD
ncbi:SPOR domain-containing protein [bacterium]|nr:SPOR domain-containing protein [bacterium]